MTTRDLASSSEAPTDQTARGSRLAGAPTRIGIMGAGAWGTALAVTAQRAGRHVSIWARDLAVLQDRMDAAPDALRAELACLTQVEALSDLVTCDAVLLVTPAQTIIDVVAQLDQAAQDAGRPLPQLVLCAKGFDRASGRPLSELLDDRTADPAARAEQLAVLSGPSFAGDVLAGAPTAVTLACADTASGEALARALSHRAFRCYWSPDTVGVQVAGAAKNVLAIGAGIVAGAKLGASAQAALIARGFVELNRIGAAMGAQPATLSGLAGLGDLVLTCSDAQSRNMSLGMRIGAQGSAAGLLGGGTLTEGVATGYALRQLARDEGLDLPICAAVASVCAETMTVDAAIDALLGRPLKSEVG